MQLQVVKRFAFGLPRLDLLLGSAVRNLSLYQQPLKITPPQAWCVGKSSCDGYTNLENCTSYLYEKRGEKDDQSFFPNAVKKKTIQLDQTLSSCISLYMYYEFISFIEKSLLQ